MGHRISIEQMDGAITALKETCRVFAPKRGGGNVVRYGEISSVSEIVLNEKSYFSPKETFYPVMQTMFYFTGNEYRESETDDKNIIIFARPCDINAVKRLDAMFLENGGHEDMYYARTRNRIKIFMIECQEGWETCFCVSMGTNRADEYDVAMRFTDDGILVDIKNSDFESLFADGTVCDYMPSYVRGNTKRVTLPEITEEDIPAIHALGIWKEISEKCVGCGGCNTVCGTCSCFDTADIIYNEKSRDGERRRLWASCMQESFTLIAGGHKLRDTQADRLRFKTLHKIYGFRKRFEREDMCVGCGRCDDRCPEKISFSDTINRLSEELGKGADK